ncbi:hypothetical protein HMPREF0971_02985 [Segatella oris F0302]|uniref:Uncharacterized protein n=1 Tax=Segatella oris F0302 TaxID=649760 RepID=D1QVK7_9BACT|nr:hypothetical protein HMPREF0971_02985 [Segatella oris F0302]
MKNKRGHPAFFPVYCHCGYSLSGRFLFPLFMAFCNSGYAAFRCR